MNLYKSLNSLDKENVAIVLDGNKYLFADTFESMLESAEADYAYKYALEHYRVLGDHQKGRMVKIYVQCDEGE